MSDAKSELCEVIINKLTEKTQEILKDNLTGIYLHGSAAMGCFNPYKSDIDVIIAVNDKMTKETKRKLMDAIIELNSMAPEKGLEISVVLRTVCKPFVYPTPFELHFSPMHLNWYLNDSDEYIEKMNGEDKDLAAHFTVINSRGKCLAGAPISSVFGIVPGEYYMDSIYEDVRGAEADIKEAPVYFILNLARVLAYKRDGLVLSKKEGGEWALAKLPAKYRNLVLTALADYEDEHVHEYIGDCTEDYAGYMLNQICGMKEEYFNIFGKCFPGMQISYERFCELLHKDSCIYFESKEDNEICAFAVVEDSAIRLICVIPSKQGQGIGTKLISEIEKCAVNKGFDKIIIGGASSGLFIGATSESWEFFKKLGFVSAGGCDEMLLNLEDFQFDKLSLHGSDIAEYGWFNGDLEEIRSAVSSVKENWTQYYNNPGNIYVAKVNGEIASFCLVDTNCQNYLTDKYCKVGMPGCVGTVPKFRNKGIGLEMVARVTEYLKTQGMKVSFIYYTTVAEWYEKIGYRTFLTECFGEKQLDKKITEF